MVDRNVLRTNQIFIVATVAVAFLIGAEAGAWLIALLAVCMAIGVLWPGSGPIQVFYRKVLLPVGVVTPNREPGGTAPHRFAQAMGATCLGLSAICLFLGFYVGGWVLGLIVLALALVNLLFGFCTGCFIYLQLGRVRPNASV